MCIDVYDPVEEMPPYSHFEKAPDGLFINNIRGVCIVEENEEGELSVRRAEVIGGYTSGANTYYPKLVERGWVPAYRADQLPPANLLVGEEYLIVFPVTNTGHDEDAEFVIYSGKEYLECFDKWISWRANANSKIPSPPQVGISRLARNVSRPIPISQDYVWYTVREIFDMIDHDRTEVISDGYYTIVFNLDRNLVTRYQLGADGHDGCPVWGLNMTYPDLMERITNKRDPREYNEYLLMGIDDKTHKPCLLLELHKRYSASMSGSMGLVQRKMIDVTTKFFKTGNPWIEPEDTWPTPEWWSRGENGQYLGIPTVPTCNQV